MKVACAVLAGFVFALLPLQLVGRENQLIQVKAITLPNVHGRIDHLAADVDHRTVFVAALGNGTLEVIDIGNGKRIRSLSGLKEPQGIAFVPELSRLFVACGADGTLRVFDTRTFQQISVVQFSGDADNVRYDREAKRIYVGYGDGAIAAVDPENDRKLGEAALPGHPESFQLEPSGSKIFVNVPTAHMIAVIDRTKMATIARWPLRDLEANFPMALDAAQHRLFVACRHPATLLVLDTESGREIARLPSAGDADDLFYDARRKQLYLSGGEGKVDIFSQTDPEHYRLADRIDTAAGARTALFIPALDLFCLAVPRRGKQISEIRVFKVQH
jgi:hypothetical protein